MIEPKKKKCSGTGKAKGFGCGEKKYMHRYGLCSGCFGDWLYSDAGKETLDKSIIRGKAKSEKEEKKVTRQKKQALKKFNFYETTAWKWCKKYVLLYYADENNMVNCSTSPHLSYKVNDRNIHVGHMIKLRDANSTNYSTAFLFDNLAPQSYVDNVKFGGKPEIMRQWLIKKHGEDKINELSIIRRQALKLDKSTLSDISDKYRNLFNGLLKERGISDPWKY